MQALLNREELELDDFWKENPLFGSFYFKIRK
jgi:hypothetical protein